MEAPAAEHTPWFIDKRNNYTQNWRKWIFYVEKQQQQVGNKLFGIIWFSYLSRDNNLTYLRYKLNQKTKKQR